MSKHHPGKPCSSCYLCGKSGQSYYTHYSTWGQRERAFLQQHNVSEPDPSSCICLGHYREAQRSHNSNFVPKWKKNIIENRKTCIYPDCEQTSKLITPLFISDDDLRSFLNVVTESEVKLCNDHYQRVYHSFKSHTCARCGIQPKPGKFFTRHCPDIDTVNSVLCGDEELAMTDRICIRCYKLCLKISKDTSDPQNGSKIQLENFIAIWQQKLNEPDTDKLTKCILHVVLHLGKAILDNQAMLLPSLSRMFIKLYTDDSPSECIVQTDEGSVSFTSKWLLKEVLFYLYYHLQYKCVHRRYGTVLYPKNGDLLTCLSWALGKSLNNSQPDEEISYEEISSTDRLNDEVTLKRSGDIINNLIHREIDRQNNLNTTTLDDRIKHLDIKTEIKNIDTQLWNFIQLVTRTRKERVSGLQTYSSTKDLRRFSIVCALQFCTNQKAATPLHMLLADTVEMCGGSRVLIKILNKLGVVISSDTHDEFVTRVAESQRQKTVWDDLKPNAFTIASVDNFDILQSHAAVYAGDQSRSYHGTTVQLVQCNKSDSYRNCTQSVGQCTREELTNERHSQDVSTETPTFNFHFSHTSNKRRISHSPASSPHQLGKRGPKRHRTIVPRTLQQQLEDSIKCPTDCQSTTISEESNPQLSLNDFVENNDEYREREILEKKMYSYIFAKQIMPCEEGDKVFTEFKDLYAIGGDQICPSSIYYMELVDENPDSSETMRYISEMLLHTYDTPEQSGYVLLTGDGKTYEHLMNVKKLYGNALEKLLIFPGDWHTLVNFQPVLMKIYYHAGLKEIAQNTGYRGETLASLERCGHFKRTHDFLTQAWQAIYRTMLEAFKESKIDQATSTCNIPDLCQVTINMLTDPLTILNLSEMIPEGHEQVNYSEFKQFLHKMGEKDSTWKFWGQFVTQDCLAYIMLHLSIRCSHWNLRVLSLKLMAPLFVAYDRKTYQRLIPYHLADIQKYPKNILECIKQGFTVSITGKKGHSVALDEAHEMCINKDMKLAIVRPSKAYLQKTSLFMRYRITAYRNLLQQLFSLSNQHHTLTIFDKEPVTRRNEENVKMIMDIIVQYNMLPTIVNTDRGLVNVFTNTVAQPQVMKDMLTFREIGRENLKSYVEFHILKSASIKTLIRQHRLLTMAPKKQGKRAVNQKLTEMKQVTQCLRQRLSWCNRTGQRYDSTHEQYSIFPRAIADEQGLPRKGVKAVRKDKIGKRYERFDVVTNSLQNWVPDLVIFDGMFLINCKPLRTMKTITDYTMLLYNRFFVPRYKCNTKEIHLVFDAPRQQAFNPKMFEQEKRDRTHSSNLSHEHIAFTPGSQLPLNWREYIQCRQCKRSIIEAVTLAFMKFVRIKLRPHQKLIIAGSSSVHEHPYCISGDQLLPSLAPQYQCTAEEADLRIWRHVHQTSATTILVYSPDTDIYNIGLTMLENNNKEIVVQINVPHSTTEMYVNLNRFISALQTDPDLATIKREHLPTVILMLYVCSGCDYTSYFAGLGKAVFLNVFFQHTAFITGNTMAGRLLFETVDTINNNFLSFLRLIGTLYYKKHYSAMVSLRGSETPQQLLSSMESNTDVTTQHKSWYNDIRSIVSERITQEADRMPSITSMWRHWLRSCWVTQLYQSAHTQNPFALLPAPEVSGWKLQNNEYNVDWECPKHQQQVSKTIDFLTKGCSCKRGCTTLRCSCVKNNSQCGPGCNCRNCKNIKSNAQPPVHMESESDSSMSESSDEETIERKVITGLEYNYEEILEESMTN